MKKKLDMHHHKIILSLTLLVFLVIGIVFASHLAAASDEVPILGIMTFSLVFLSFGLAIISLSIVIMTRDELHAMHEENRQHFHNVHERIKRVHYAVTGKKGASTAAKSRARKK